MTIPADPTAPSQSSTGISGKITTSGKPPASSKPGGIPAPASMANTPAQPSETGPVAALKTAVDMTSAARDVLGMVQAANYSGVALPPAPFVPVITAEPGQTTTEFWASQATSVLAAFFMTAADFGAFHFTAAQQHDVTIDALLAIGLIQIGYAISRGIRKRGTQG